MEDLTTPPRPALPRPWRSALLTALGAVYLPQLLPLLITDLADHGHCLGIYGQFFVILVGLGPGVHARILSEIGEPGEEYVLVAVAASVTLGLLGTVAWSHRHWRFSKAVTVVVAIVSAVLSLGAVALIRA